MEMFHPRLALVAVLEVCALQTGGGTENWDKVECLVVCLVE